MKNEWETKKLGDVCSFLNRGVSPRYLEKGGVVVLNQRCVRDHLVSFEVARRHDIGAKRIGNERLLRAGDVLVNSTGTGTLGRVAQLRANPPEPTTVDSHVTIVRPMPKMFFADFFGYMLQDIEDELKESGDGCGGQTELNRSVLAQAFSVRFPKSLTEQERIVCILDSAFSAVATARANAEKNLQSVDNIFEGQLQSVFSQSGPGWETKALGDIAEFKNGLNYNKSSSGQTLAIVGVGNFQGNYYVPFSELETATIDGKLAKEYRLEQDDILTVRSNGSKHLVGRCMLVGSVDGTVSYSGFIIRIRFNTSKIFPKFLLHFMKCRATRDALTRGGGGANITNINQKKLSRLPVPLPPYKAQAEIAAALDALHEECQRLTTIYRRKLAALDALKSSLLHYAFSGAL